VIESILAGLAATTPAEGIAVVLGFLYAVLTVKRSRWGWACGAISSAIFVVLAWNARLPMQALLQGYYVAMGIYGFWHWSKDEGAATKAVSTLPLRQHAIAWVAIVVFSAIAERFLSGTTRAAWPLLDSLTTCGTVFATWLSTQVKLESWLYFIVFDAISVFLFAAQGLMFAALLFAVYLVVSAFGFVSWFKTWRAVAQPT
jgi:nicotinamide mononucleotide transporter